MDVAVSYDVLQAARRLAARQELAGASMEEIAVEAGVSRVTLYRRGETREVIINALRDELAREERDLVLPILAAPGDARSRLRAVMVAVCEVTESRLDLFTGLNDAVLNAVYHDPGSGSQTRSVFLDPVVRLLRDGALDGSVRPLPDPVETATALYTQITYAYLHLRREHEWSRERASRQVVDLADHSIGT